MQFGFSRHSMVRAVVSLAFLGAATGCIITTDNTPAPVANGNLAITWDIQGGTAVASCTSHTAATFQFRVYSLNGAQVGPAYQQPCTTFSASIGGGLPPGSYTLQAEMLSAAGTARTTTVGAPPAAAVTFTISSNLTTTVPVTFPDTSFL
jgi:hypothetical protein